MEDRLDAMKFTILRFDTLASTNTEAMERAQSGADEGLCIVARQQTAGRGRRSRTWVSPKDAGLYLSIVLRPKLDVRFLPLITLTAGIAVHDTLADLGLEPDIKWVNDILINDKKISGILAETAETGSGPAVVVGIGINLTAAGLPPAIAATATTIECESGRKVRPAELAAALTRHFGPMYVILNGSNGPEAIIEMWRSRSTYFSGKNVRVIVESEVLTGVTDGLEANGALRLRRHDGSITVIQAGDVEQLRSARRSEKSPD